MSELTTAGLVLFLLICGELMLFFVMNGADFGAGMSTFFVKGNRERDEIVRVSSAVWFGNETWLVVGMGTMFASFPHWYAGLASGYYLVFILALVFLILRGAAFEFRLKWKLPALNSLWNVALFAGSLLPPFLIGMVFASTTQGVPIVNGIVRPGFFDVVTPLSVWTGILLVLFSLAIGLARIVKFTKEDASLEALMRNRLKTVLYVLIGALVVETALLYIFTRSADKHPIAIILWGIICLAVLAVSQCMTAKKRDQINYWLIAVAMASFLVLIFWSLFPDAVINAAGGSLTLAEAASGPVSQNTALIGSIIMLPLLALGQWVTYYFQNKVYHIPDSDINL